MASEEFWACEACTYQNSLAVDVCAVCGVSMDSFKHAQQLDALVPHPSDHAEDNDGDGDFREDDELYQLGRAALPPSGSHDPGNKRKDQRTHLPEDDTD